MSGPQNIREPPKNQPLKAVVCRHVRHRWTCNGPKIVLPCISRPTSAAPSGPRADGPWKWHQVFRGPEVPDYNPEGPSTQSLSTLVPNTIKSMVFGIRDHEYWVFGPSG